MRSWRYIDIGDDGQPIEHVLTEAQILAEYYPWWAKQMERVGKAVDATPQACIEDWIVVHWAEAV